MIGPETGQISVPRRARLGRQRLAGELRGPALGGAARVFFVLLFADQRFERRLGLGRRMSSTLADLGLDTSWLLGLRRPPSRFCRCCASALSATSLLVGGALARLRKVVSSASSPVWIACDVLGVGYGARGSSLRSP